MPHGDFSYFDASKDYPSEAKSLGVPVKPARAILEALFAGFPQPSPSALR